MKIQNFEDKFMDYLYDNPNFCVYTGVERKLGELPDPGKNKRITLQGKLKMLKSSLEQVDYSELNRDEKVDYQLYKLFLEQCRLELEIEIDGIPKIMRMPVATQIITGPLFMFFANDPREPKLRLVNIVARLSKVDEYLTSYMRNIKKPIQRWVDMELERIETVPGFLETLYHWAKDIDFKNLNALEKAIQSTKSSLFRYETFLKNSETSNAFFIGPKQMQEVLDSRGIELTPQELKTVAKEFLENNEAEIERLRKKLVKKYEQSEDMNSADLKKFLDEKYALNKKGDGFSFVLEAYENERAKILSFIKEQELFPIMENQDMAIMQTPDFMVPTIPAGAMMPPLPLREGCKRSLVYLTLSEQLLAEHTELSIPCMMIHEGIPGHHLQFAWSCHHHSKIRRIFGANDLSEGWTTMLEDYMLDIGYGSDLEDELRFSGKKDIARIGARVLIDLYFMSGDKSFLDIGMDIDLSSDDPFIAAGNLLAKVTGFVPDRVQGELNWYSQESGYPLSYLTGNHLVWNLKDEYIKEHKELDAKALDKKFHLDFLQAGVMPLSLLRKYMLKKDI